MKLAIAGIAAEAIANAVVHAKATSIRADVCQSPKGITIKVWDDGQGFNVAEVARRAGPRQRVGLRLLRERARLAGGRVTIASHPSGGTVIFAHFPKNSNGRR